MGVNLAERIDGIFRKPENFDISGFCHADLVTPALVDAIIAMTPEERKELLRMGYGFSRFKPDASDGIIFKMYRKGSACEIRKLYYNPYYPKEVARMRKGAEESK